jgi:hypothetical protein
VLASALPWHETGRPTSHTPWRSRLDRIDFYDGEDGDVLWLQPRHHRARWTDDQWLAFHEYKEELRDAKREEKRLFASEVHVKRQRHKEIKEERRAAVLLKKQNQQQQKRVLWSLRLKQQPVEVYRICAQCQRKFSVSHGRRKFCSNPCRAQHAKQRAFEKRQRLLSARNENYIQARDYRHKPLVAPEIITSKCARCGRLWQMTRKTAETWNCCVGWEWHRNSSGESVGIERTHGRLRV